MLSGLRLIFGGFCVALMAALFGLGLATTSRSYIAPPAGALPARGALIEQADHPEWKQLLVRAALRRADELNRLSELPGGLPVQYGGRFLFVALPGASTAPDDETGSITETPGVTIPIDIGETSSTELPVRKESAQTPSVTPAAADKTVRKPAPLPLRRAKPADAENTLPNLFEALFGDGSGK